MGKPRNNQIRGLGAYMMDSVWKLEKQYPSQKLMHVVKLHYRWVLRFLNLVY
jgi:hypothetical protein